MGFYSIYKVLKDIIKTLFGLLAFKILLIFVLIIILLCFIDSNKSNAYSVYNFDDVLFTDTVINQAKNVVGNSIWNNEDYDIFLTYQPRLAVSSCCLL